MVLTLIQRPRDKLHFGKAANGKAVYSEDSELSDDGGQRSSDGDPDISGSDGHQRMEEQRLVAYNKEGKPARVGIS